MLCSHHLTARDIEHEDPARYLSHHPGIGFHPNLHWLHPERNYVLPGMVDLSLVHYDSSVGVGLVSEVKKREKRRLQREKEFGPERKVVLLTAESAALDCGHTIINPPVSKTVRMIAPKFYRCKECLPSSNG